MSKPSILIVDDEPINLKRVAECLSRDYELHLARSGADALVYLNSYTADILLLDINMPLMTGFEVATQLRQNPKTANIPIIYLTGDNSEHTIAMAFNSGAADYIPKPFRDEELLARVKNRLETDRLKRELHTALEKNEHLLNIVNQYVAYVKTDLNGIITKVSTSFCAAFQAKKEQLINQNIRCLKSGHTSQEIYQALWETIQQGKTFVTEIENCNCMGGTNWYHVTITPDVDKFGKAIGYIAFYQNIDDKVQYKHNAQIDFLTGLYNRSKFEETMTKILYAAHAQENHKPFSLIMADIDHFKEVNDIYGHDTGDIVLKEFSLLLAQQIRQEDTLARWGGEEFIILCPHTPMQEAASLAERLRFHTDQFLFSIIGHKTASFGVAQYRPHMDAKKLFLEVDQALYAAKQAGRNKVMIFDKN